MGGWAWDRKDIETGGPSMQKVETQSPRHIHCELEVGLSGSPLQGGDAEEMQCTSQF